MGETVRRVDPDLPLLDLTPVFAAGIEEGRTLYFGTNTHWSVEGNELAGVALASLLAERWFGRSVPTGGDLERLARTRTPPDPAR